MSNTLQLNVSNAKLRQLKIIHQTDSLTVLDAVEQFMPVDAYRKLYAVGKKPSDPSGLSVADVDLLRNAINEMGAALMHAMPYVPRQFSTERERKILSIGG